MHTGLVLVHSSPLVGWPSEPAGYVGAIVDPDCFSPDHLAGQTYLDYNRYSIDISNSKRKAVKEIVNENIIDEDSDHKRALNRPRRQPDEHRAHQDKHFPCSCSNQFFYVI